MLTLLVGRWRGGRVLGATLLAAVLAACAPADRGEFYDPYEAENRARHAFNRAIDETFLRRSAEAYGSAVPAPVREGLSNFAGNLDQPLAVVNNLLQLRFANAAHNAARFLVNSTVGLAGLIDVASEIDLRARPTDFGETLYVWGVGEGAYLEVPFLGPSTERDFAGTLVDYALNPVRWVVPHRWSPAVTVTGIAARFSDRQRYAEFIDEVLYQSADSYAQARLLYLQNRRFRLGDTTFVQDFDPYEDLP